MMCPTTVHSKKQLLLGPIPHEPTQCCQLSSYINNRVKKKKFDEIRSNFVLQELPEYSIEGFSAVLLSKFSHQITCDRKPSTQEKTEN